MKISREGSEVVLRIPIGKAAGGTADLFENAGRAILDGRITGNEFARVRAGVSAQHVADIIRKHNH